MKLFDISDHEDIHFAYNRWITTNYPREILHLGVCQRQYCSRVSYFWQLEQLYSLAAGHCSPPNYYTIKSNYKTERVKLKEQKPDTSIVINWALQQKYNIKEQPDLPLESANYPRLCILRQHMSTARQPTRWSPVEETWRAATGVHKWHIRNPFHILFLDELGFCYRIVPEYLVIIQLFKKLFESLELQGLLKSSY